MAWRQHLDFDPVNFVRGDAGCSGSATSEPSGNRGRHSQKPADGKDIHEFYKDLVGLDKTSDGSQAAVAREKTSPRQLTKTTRRKRKEPKRSQINSRSIDSGNFLRAAQTGDLTALESGLSAGLDIDTVDQFGWTALMCAAQSGHSDAVKFLVQRGANLNIRDKRHMTAWDIAVKSKKTEIVHMLTMGKFTDVKDEDDDCVISSQEPRGTDNYTCDLCNGEFSTSESLHKASTVHLFNMKFKTQSTSYHIQPSNQGYKMMRRSGWREEDGLGPEGSGQKYPIKTVLKRDRVGLGNKKGPKAKVTHFDPHDRSAVKHVRHKDRTEPDLSTVTKKQTQIKAKRERRKEIKFRQEFHDF